MKILMKKEMTSNETTIEIGTKGAELRNQLKNVVIMYTALKSGKPKER